MAFTAVGPWHRISGVRITNVSGSGIRLGVQPTVRFFSRLQATRLPGLPAPHRDFPWTQVSQQAERLRTYIGNKPKDCSDVTAIASARSRPSSSRQMDVPPRVGVERDAHHKPWQELQDQNRCLQHAPCSRSAAKPASRS